MNGVELLCAFVHRDAAIMPRQWRRGISAAAFVP